MSDCCSNSCETGKHHNTYRCPVNGKEYKEVSVKTIMHHIKEPWHWKDKSQSYYFCDDPDCQVVYFGQDDSVFEISDVRIPVAIKEKSSDSFVCYCFGVTINDAVTHPETKSFVVEKTKGHMCECEVRNPSGSCCLKDFPKT